MKNLFFKLGETSHLSILFITLLITLCFTACQKTDKESIPFSTASSNQKAIKNEVGKITDLYFKFYKELNAKALGDLLTDDCITMGADPNEVWNKATLIKKIKTLKANPNSKSFTNNLNFDLIDRIIQISNNGNTATVTDHSKVSFSNMMIKKTTKLKKVGNDWKINYINTALVT